MRRLSSRPGGGRGRQEYGGDGCKADIATVDIRLVEREKAEKERRKQGIKIAGGVAFKPPILQGQSPSGVFVPLWHRGRCPFFLKRGLGVSSDSLSLILQLL